MALKKIFKDQDRWSKLVFMVVMLSAGAVTADITGAEIALSILTEGPLPFSANEPTEESERINLDPLENELKKGLKNIQSNVYEVKFGDTLDDIIKTYLFDIPVKKSILRQAVILANPHAFRRNNPHWMYSDRQLKLPELQDIRRAIFKKSDFDASQQVINDDHQNDWIYYP